MADAGWEAVRAGRRAEAGGGVRLVDIDRPETVVDACAGVDLVINPVSHPRLSAERAVLRHGGMLLNVASLRARERSDLAAEAAGARGVVVLHAGLAPGLTTLVAAELLGAHPEADTLETAITFSARSAGGRAAGEFGFRLLTGARHHPTALLPFPAPLGPRRCLEVGMAGEGWAEDLAAGRATPLYVHLAERPLRAAMIALNVLRLIAFLPVSGRRAVPAELSREPAFEWVAVLRGGRRLAARVIEGVGDYRTTIAATRAFGQALLAKRAAGLTRPGVWGVEKVFTLSDLRPSLEAQAVRIREA
jgi:hypothetical protein